MTFYTFKVKVSCRFGLV